MRRLLDGGRLLQFYLVGGKPDQGSKLYLLPLTRYLATAHLFQLLGTSIKKIQDGVWKSVFCGEGGLFCVF